MSAPDPRGYITPDAFRVAPHLLGLPLASPSRRGVAMMLDLLLVAFLVHVGGGVLFGLAAGALFFKVASGRLGSRLPRPLRGALRVGGAAVLFVVAMNVWDGVGGDGEEPVRRGSGPRVAAASSAGGASTLGKVIGSAQVATAFTRLDASGSRVQADAELRRAVAGLRGVGMGDTAIAEALREFAAEADQPWVRDASTAMAATLVPLPVAAEPVRPPAPDSLARAWAAAFAAGDSAALRTLQPQLLPTLAADTLAAMQQRVERLQTERTELRVSRDTLQAQLERGEKTGVLAVMRRVADDLGLGFGWTGLYFTAFLAFWKGQTPGKRMMGMRVLRLDGKPMTLWSSFERFGGYAASIFTGLLGFVQIFWDRNRQGMHDKIVETVVVRLVPGIEELAAGPSAAGAGPGGVAPRG